MDEPWYNQQRLLGGIKKETEHLGGSFMRISRRSVTKTRGHMHLKPDKIFPMNKYNTRDPTAETRSGMGTRKKNWTRAFQGGCQDG